ncbi:exonuclease domain-containing protein [Gangjinia marincola]|uniref:Excinuclease cho n=1 Tax=Gangjinia marincola TaxID=578463 RepID=A0ABN1MHD8_9FLAO
MNFKETKYVVVDVETTGGVRYGRMTEICIVTIENLNVTDVYTSLINPQELIPRNIIALTGITNEMVADAPTFEQIAHVIEEKTRDAIFVAHSVNFDYGFLKKELSFVGIPFLRKKLCTVRLSRKLIPGLPSYSLGRLCRSVGISLIGAHRAEADTRATAKLFLKLLAIDEVDDFEVFANYSKKSTRQGTLPPHLKTKDFERLPETPGIYLFKNQAGKILYVGKAKNIKSRVLSHMYAKAQKSLNLCNATHQLDFVETGNELCALLLEADYIRKYYPPFNRAQKRPVNTYQIISYVNQKGIIQLALGKSKKKTNSVLTLYNRETATELLMRLCEMFELCPRYCSLQVTYGECSHYKVKHCNGICRDKEEVETYNLRVAEALRYIENQQETYVITDRGRTPQEKAIVLIENGEYQGFGFIDQTETITEFDEFKGYIDRYKNSYHTTQIVSAYMRNKVISHDIIRPKVGEISLSLL